MAEALRKPTETRTYRERIRELVEQDRVGAARALLAEALERGDHCEDLSGWQRILAPAEVRLSDDKELDFDRTPEFRWVAAHADAYRGQWVALLHGELLAHSASLEEVISTLKGNPPKQRPLLLYIQHPPEIPGLAEARTYSEKIKAYVEADCVGAARALVAEALEAGDHSEELLYWQSVLAPAKVLRVGGETAPDSTPDFEWLKTHSDSYRGQWVALLGGELLAHRPTLQEILADTEKHPKKQWILLHPLRILC